MGWYLVFTWIKKHIADYLCKFRKVLLPYPGSSCPSYHPVNPDSDSSVKGKIKDFQCLVISLIMNHSQQKQGTQLFMMSQIIQFFP